MKTYLVTLLLTATTLWSCSSLKVTQAQKSEQSVSLPGGVAYTAYMFNIEASSEIYVTKILIGETDVTSDAAIYALPKGTVMTTEQALKKGIYNITVKIPSDKAAKLSEEATITYKSGDKEKNITSKISITDKTMLK